MFKTFQNMSEHVGENKDFSKEDVQKFFTSSFGQRLEDALYMPWNLEGVEVSIDEANQAVLVEGLDPMQSGTIPDGKRPYSITELLLQSGFSPLLDGGKLSVLIPLDKFESAVR